MRRRDFISLLCGTTLSLQSVARAQTAKIPCIGILCCATAELKSRISVRYWEGSVTSAISIVRT